jgi:hypothetical protein
MTIKENDVAFIRTTGEAIFILSFLPEEGTVDVRRPIAGQEGIKHVVETFRVQELESLDEQRERFLAERKQVYEKFGPKQEQDSFSPIN